jgi:hypothetical protein
MRCDERHFWFVMIPNGCLAVSHLNAYNRDKPFNPFTTILHSLEVGNEVRGRWILMSSGNPHARSKSQPKLVLSHSGRIQHLEPII